MFVYLWLVPHPTVFVTQLWIRGMFVCVCVCICMYVCARVCMYFSWYVLAHQLTVGLLFEISSKHSSVLVFRYLYFFYTLQFILPLAPKGFIVHCPLSGASPSYVRPFVSFLCPGPQLICVHCPEKYCCILNCEMSSSRAIRTHSPWNIKLVL
jgi:hypothetical protein